MYIIIDTIMLELKYDRVRIIGKWVSTSQSTNILYTPSVISYSETVKGDFKC